MLKTISIMIKDTSSYIDHKTGSQKENTLGRAGQGRAGQGREEYFNPVSIGIKRTLHYTTSHHSQNIPHLSAV